MININGDYWDLVLVHPHSSHLRRSDGTYTLGVTDNNVKTVFLSSAIHGALYKRVLCHELTHCFCFSYDIDIPLDEEERLCNFVAAYGRDIIETLDNILLYGEMVI